MTRSSDSTSVARTWVRRSAALAVAIALLAGAAVWLLGTSRTGYEAEAQVVVLPEADLDVDEASSYYETLNQGQIIGTFAELIADASAEEEAVWVEVVPDTAVIVVRALADDAAEAEAFAAAAVERGAERIDDLETPYRLHLAREAAGTGTSVALPAWQVLAAAGVVAAVLGVAAYLALLYLGAIWRTTRGEERQGGPAVPAAGETRRLASPAMRSDG